MIYFATGSDPTFLEALQERSDLGVIVTYKGNASASYPQGSLFVADNGCFSAKWDEPGWKSYLQRHAMGFGRQTLWAVCPDVVGDHVATLERWHQHSHWIRALGLCPAFVLQNGCRSYADVPADARALFIGGDNEYKLGADPARVLAEAPNDMWFHMGRVNSLKRLVHAAAIGCHSVDGTYLAFGPKVNLPRVCGWLDTVHQEVAS